ncbi:MAG: hypothetical protein KatS3mg063_0582 [Tepidiforma sp.]|jgi:four helix bundle protein|uniref:Four helix bundle protein n=1 Tax=Tepidiforma bonchosmolovskayae TaxID=2601677 RepID=A0ABX6C1D6_9CHLR|nr:MULTISPECIES: four helix bundle protein [Tepidiforma]QFG03091.1 four helix bundle protein [Tepidiforma bonchosmolovskayae]GIW14729.1 MAG: hypothetical protein KatS3mg063_0582 [Tepidiforma sp.]
MSGPLPYRKLEVWHLAQDLAEQVLLVARRRHIKEEEWFRDQICGAAMSVSANIAEGNGRSTPLDYASFVDRARSSLFELDCWLDMARRLSWIQQAEYDRFAERIDRLSAGLFQLARSLRSRRNLPSRDP